jgi:hypothetical protein
MATPIRIRTVVAQPTAQPSANGVSQPTISSIRKSRVINSARKRIEVRTAGSAPSRNSLGRRRMIRAPRPRRPAPAKSSLIMIDSYRPPLMSMVDPVM